MPRPSSRCSRRPTGATRSSGTRAPTITTPCSTSKGRVWLAATVRGMDNPAFCKKGSDHPSAKVFPLEKSQRQVAMLDPKTMKYTFVDTCFAHPSPAVRLRRRQYAVVQRHRPGGRLGQHQDVRRNRRCGEGAGLGAVRARHQRQRQARRVCRAERAGRCGEGQAHHCRLGALRGDAESEGRLDLVHRRRVCRPAGFLRFDPKTKLSEVYYMPKPGFGIRGGDIDRNGVLWGSGSSGHLVSFDRRKCKGAAQRPERDRQSLSGRLGVLQISRPRLRGLREYQRRGELLHLGRPAQHARPGRERSDVDRQSQRRLRRAEGRQDGHRCAFRIRWASMPRASTGASTIRMPAGKAAACGARAATARRG